MNETPETLRALVEHRSGAYWEYDRFIGMAAAVLAHAAAWEADRADRDALREAAREYLDATVEGTATLGQQAKLAKVLGIIE